jgi:hypothetical protein
MLPNLENKPLFHGSFRRVYNGFRIIIIHHPSYNSIKPNQQGVMAAPEVSSTRMGKLARTTKGIITAMSNQL